MFSSQRHPGAFGGQRPVLHVASNEVGSLYRDQLSGFVPQWRVITESCG